VPCWTTRPYFFAASTHLRPSKTIGFSTYTSFPAWQAQIVISECQWLQVATETASSDLSSSASRTSATHLGRLPAARSTVLVRESKSDVSGSIKYATSTFFILVNSEMCEPPRPLIPATPTRIVSLAPMTLPEAFVPAIVNSGKAVLAAAAAWTNRRRDRRDMLGSFAIGGNRTDGWPKLQHGESAV
jgi:hypothetical protein